LGGLVQQKDEIVMDMNYLPLGKLGCGNCEDVDYYCEDCMKKIIAVVNEESAQPRVQADVATGAAPDEPHPDYLEYLLQNVGDHPQHR